MFVGEIRARTGSEKLPLAFSRHGHVDPREIVSLLEDAGLRCIDSGPVGISSLHYVHGRRYRITVTNHHISDRGWIVIVAIPVLAAAHVALVGVALRPPRSLVVVRGLAGIAVLKYARWRSRR